MKISRLLFPLGLAVCALLALTWSIDSIAASTPKPRDATPRFAPAAAPVAFAGRADPVWLGATGLVEPVGEEVRVGVHRSGVVVRVAVSEGDSVRAGDLLLAQDPRAATAQWRLALAELAAAEAAEAELIAQVGPLAAAVDAARAGVERAEAALALAQAEQRRSGELADPRALSAEERGRRENAVVAAAALLAEARAEWARATAERDLVLDGPSTGARLIAARARTEAARAEVAVRRVELELLEVHAPIDGVVLAVDTRAGESLTAGADSVLTLGRPELCVRVEFAEEDAPRFQVDGEAHAVARGDAHTRYPLRFVRVVPKLRGKRTLAGGASERVDTRVMEVIYALEGASGALAVGQRVDVFVALSGAGVR